MCMDALLSHVWLVFRKAMGRLGFLELELQLKVVIWMLGMELGSS